MNNFLTGQIEAPISNIQHYYGNQIGVGLSKYAIDTRLFLLVIYICN